MRTAGVLFDLWGTLIERTTPPLSTGLARGLGLEDDGPVAAYLQCAGRRDQNVDFLAIAGELWRAQRGGEPSAAFMREAADVRDEFVSGARLAAGAEQVLTGLRAAGLRVGALSNATAVTLAVVDRLRLAERLDDVWVSCVTGHLKPEPEAFRSVIDAWALEPAAVHMVGDSLDADVAGALGAGMPATWLRPDAAAGTPPPGVKAASGLAEIPGLLGVVLPEVVRSRT